MPCIDVALPDFRFTLSPLAEPLPTISSGREHGSLLLFKRAHTSHDRQNWIFSQGISGFSADVDEDYAWLSQNAFSKNPEVFPADNFGPEDFRWAVGVALSRSFFVNGELRLTPLVDFANHASIPGVLEPTGGWGFDARRVAGRRMPPSFCGGRWFRVVPCSLLMKNATFVGFGELLLGPFARETVRLLCNSSCATSLVHTSLLYLAPLFRCIYPSTYPSTRVCVVLYLFFAHGKAGQRACSGRRRWC